MPMVTTRILVIEDESAHAEAIRRSVECLEGAEVRLMASLREFRDQGPAWNPHLVLMDLNLPDGRAIDVLGDPAEPKDFPIVVMTSYGSEATAVEAIKRGAFDYLVKSPDTFRGLARTLERLLREWQVYQDARVAQRQLAASEAKFRSLSESSPDFIIRYDQEHRHTYLNPAALKMLGRSAAAILGKTHRECGYPEDLCRFWEAKIEHVFQTAQPIRTEFDFPSPAGLVTHDWSLTPELDGEGRVCAVVGISRDITERRHMEAALREAHQFNANIIQGAQEGIIVYGLDLKYLVWNAFMEDLSGLPASEVLGRHPLELFPFLREAGVIERLERILAGESVPSIEFPFRVANTGKVGWTTDTSAPLINSKGEIIGVIGMVRDITDQKGAEQALETASQRFQRVSAMTSDIAYSCSAEKGGAFVIDWITGAADRITGYSIEEITAHGCWRFLVVEEDRALFDRWVVGLAPDTQGSCELRIRHKQGDLLWISSFAECISTGSPGKHLLYGALTDITERRRTEEALRTSRELFTRAFAISPDSININRLEDGVYVAINEGFTRITGYTEADVLGNSSLSATSQLWVNPKDREALVAGLKATGEVIGLEAAFRMKEGQQIIGLMSARLLEIGGTPHILSITRDITERKRAEEALHEREELLRLSLQGADLGAWDWELTTGRVTVNERWSEMLGYRPGELDPHKDRFEARIHPDDYTNVKGALEAHLRGETASYESTHRVRRKTGEWLWVLDRGRVIQRSKQGEPLRMCGTHLDVTNGKTHSLLEEARLRLIEFSLNHSLDEFLQATVDEACCLTDSPVGFYHFLEDDEQTIILHAWSTRTRQEFCTAEGSGTHYPVAQAGVWADCVRQRCAVIHNDYSQAPNRKGLPPGHTQVQREMVLPLFRGGRIVAILGVGNKADLYGEYDLQIVEKLAEVAWVIAERKRAEEQQRHLQSQLQQAQKMESLGSLAGGVAHDMNNVLGAILGLASANLETQPANSPTYRAFDTISKAALRGGQMVKSLLSFARQSPAEAQDLDMNVILREEIRLLERTTLSKVRLVVDLAPDLRPIRGDASALTHAFMNLCVNAVDAMPENGTLTLRTRNVDNEWIEVQVEDTGTGMSKEIQAKALDPFFTTKGVGKGTGLGLSMAYSTVKAHQGQLEIQSEPGQGTCVSMRFPACAVAPPLPAPAPLPSVVSAPGSLSVLLVDDDELIQSSIQMLLEVLGHQAIPAACGEEALAKLEGGLRPDVVILDMNMPGLGGAGTLPRLRLLNPTVPVLLATGRADQTALELVNAHAHVTLLSKPFSMKELKQGLEHFAKPKTTEYAP
ncbi:MAG: PAS domain S-box protein [Holophaga sp.]